MALMALLDLTGVVLAGGRSTRMGRDKAALVLGAETLAARAVRRLRAIFRHALASANDPATAALFFAEGVPVVADALGEGPLAGISAALAAAPTERIFCCAVDMPWIAEPLVRYLCELSERYDIVVPRGEPLCAVYARSCLAPFTERLRAGRYKVDAAFEGLAVRVVEPDESARYDAGGRSFRNVNTPEELRKATEVPDDG